MNIYFGTNYWTGDSATTIKQKLGYLRIFIEDKDKDKAKEAIKNIYKDKYAIYEQEIKEEKETILKKFEEINILKKTFSNRNISKIERGFIASIVLNLNETNLIGYQDCKIILSNLPKRYLDFMSVNDFGLNPSYTARNYESIGYSSLVNDYLSEERKEELLYILEDKVFDLAHQNNSDTLIPSFQKFKEYILSDKAKTFYI